MSEEDSDVDGKPMETESKPKTISGVGTGFVQSKWEVIDEEDIKGIGFSFSSQVLSKFYIFMVCKPCEAEAVTSAEIFAETKRKDAEKVEQDMEEEKKDKKEAKPLYLQSDAWRQKMRAIEVKVIEYCEQLRVKEESPQAEAYRSSLIKQATEEFHNNPRYS